VALVQNFSRNTTVVRTPSGTMSCNVLDPYKTIIDSGSRGVMPTLSVVMPTYRASGLIRTALASIVSQRTTFPWEIVICDNNSKDLHPELFAGIQQTIRVYEFHSNIGYPGNLQRCIDMSRGEFLMLLGHDDVVANGYLQRLIDEFSSSSVIGAITRSYYWFDDSIDSPVRAKRIPRRLRELKSIDVTASSSFRDVALTLDSLDQLSGLAFRRSAIAIPVGSSIFTAHVEPFVDVLSRQTVRFLTSYSIAVRISSSQARNINTIYSESPVASWLRISQMFTSNSLARKVARDFVCRNYIGLLQIRNYSERPIRYVLRESKMLLQYRWMNLFSVSFWLLSISCLVLPRSILRKLVDLLKPLSLIGQSKPALESQLSEISVV